MSQLTRIMGQRIRNYRIRQNLSQEKLAELCGCHPTYIGQIERGEKNATIESVGRIAFSLNVSLSDLFEKIDIQDNEENIPLKCYEFIASKRLEEQKILFDILLGAEKYKNI